MEVLIKFKNTQTATRERIPVYKAFQDNVSTYLILASLRKNTKRLVIKLHLELERYTDEATEQSGEDEGLLGCKTR